MADLLLHLGATIHCTHATGTGIMTPPPRPVVTVSKMPVATQSAQFTVAGCLFTVGTKFQPCLTIRWLVPALRVRVKGSPVLLQSSRGVGLSGEQVPQGPPISAATQLRVKGT